MTKSQRSRAMREFVSYVLESFRGATGWNRDNGYSELNETAGELLNFHTPRGLRMTLSSLATPHFATGYNLGSIGVVDGYISYLYSSVPLTNVVAESESIPLPILLRSYRQAHGGRVPFLTSPASECLPPSQSPAFSSTPSPTRPSNLSRATPSTSATPPTSLPPHTPSPLFSTVTFMPAAEQLTYIAQQARKLVDKPALLYGRLYLPQSMLEAYVVKRLASQVQLQLRAVSNAQLPNGGTMLGIVQYDQGKYGIEGLASTDGGLLGVRGLYNFGARELFEPLTSDAHVYRQSQQQHASHNNKNSRDGGGIGNGSAEQPHLRGGRFSAGGEIYYGTLNKSGGVSLGARFTTLPGHRGTPLTATMTINPLMGNISATYAVVAREYCSLATKFDFNVYSYESEWAVGMELWSKRRLAGLVAVDEAASDGQDLSSATSLPPKTSEAHLPSTERFRERSHQAKLEWRLDDEAVSMESKPKKKQIRSAPLLTGDDAYQGVLKARLDQNLKMGLMWEGRIKSFLFSLGSAVDLNKLDQPFRTLGLEIQFSS